MEPTTELKMTDAVATGQADMQPARTDQCCDDELCSCGKPLRPSARKLLTYLLVGLVTHVSLRQVASFARSSVMTVAELVVPSLVSEDAYDDWDGFGSEAQQSPLVALTNGTCQLRDDNGVPGKASTLGSVKFIFVFLLVEVATTAVFVVIRKAMESCFARLRPFVTALF
ncbi:uncharacterized protein LOC144100025 [Amblyomma americanum]